VNQDRACLSDVQLRDTDESDFDYETVYLPEGEAFGKSYEDASLLEDLSANANRAFQSVEGDPRVLSQGDRVGFFGAKLADNVSIQPSWEWKLAHQPANVTPDRRLLALAPLVTAS
jgi:hypothetical protein